MPVVKTNTTPAFPTTVSGNLSGTLNNVVGRVADLATLDFFFKRNSQTNTPERIVNVPPVNKDIQGPQFAVLHNPWVIGGAALAAVALVVLIVRK